MTQCRQSLPYCRCAPLRAGPRHLGRILAILLLGLALLSTGQPARADLPSFLTKLGKLDLPDPIHAPALLTGRRAGAVIQPHPKGGLAVTMAGQTGTMTLTVAAVGDLVPLLKQQSGDIFLPATMAERDLPLLKSIATAFPDRIRLVTRDGSDLPLRHRKLADGRLQWVVTPDANLSVTLDAWSRSATLNAPIMRALLSRMRVIALVPKTDQVQRLALAQKLGDRVGFAATEAELDAQLAAASRRVLVVLGHVEDGRFVLRDARGKVLVDRSVDAVTDIVDKRQSMALLLGCRVACSVARTGPLNDIDALQAVAALSPADESETPLQFLQSMAKTVGPLHVEQDALGRLVGLADADLNPATPATALATAPIRVVVSAGLAPPVTVGSILLNGLQAVIFAAYLSGAAWIFLLFFGLSPRRTWRSMGETYVTMTGRAELDTVPLSRTERLLLLLFGSWAYVALFLGGFLYLTLWLLLPLALLLGKPLQHIGLADADQLTATAEPRLAAWLPKWVNAAVSPIANAVAFGALLLVLADRFWPQVIFTNDLALISAWTAAVTLGLLLQRPFPFLRLPFHAALFLVALPSLLMFQAIYRLPPLLTRRPGDRRHA